MKSEWRVTRDPMLKEGRQCQVYRLRDVCAVDHSGNREYMEGFMDKESAYEKAKRFNNKRSFVDELGFLLEDYAIGNCTEIEYDIDFNEKCELVTIKDKKGHSEKIIVTGRSLKEIAISILRSI